MRVERQNTAEVINRVVNDPTVRPYVADVSEGTLDLTVNVTNPDNVMLMGEWGGCLFLRLMPCLYEVHTAILEPGRGAWSKEFLWSVGLFMFTRTNAVEIVTRVPKTHLGAKQASISAGMKYAWTEKNGCKFTGQVMDVDIYSATVQDWMFQAPWLEQIGADFHAELNKQAQELGVTEPPHENDPTHNRVVGICYEMFKGGQGVKAEALYNRWAKASRHPQIALLSLDPPIIQFDIGKLAIVDGKIKVIL